MWPEPLNFVTVATPHLGSRGNNQVPFFFLGNSDLKKLQRKCYSLDIRRTGRHLFLTDAEKREPPLLRRMVDDHGDLHFILLKASDGSYKELFQNYLEKQATPPRGDKFWDGNPVLEPHILRKHGLPRFSLTKLIDDGCYFSHFGGIYIEASNKETPRTDAAKRKRKSTVKTCFTCLVLVADHKTESCNSDQLEDLQNIEIFVVGRNKAHLFHVHCTLLLFPTGKATIAKYHFLVLRYGAWCCRPCRNNLVFGESWWWSLQRLEQVFFALL
ncbi:hypothetical protein IFM89_016323 [Coptis chinensis]|uniref:DUF676 domain-containing protein n=1 Tax=Coptis chinensis TaxID=261450 RepID=A0A835HF81_9MAGN|nr:hypothetical protein IFM89_016323 [Coptis chinensis]